jgi:hypothetical protein
MRRRAATLLLVLAAAGCGGDDPEPAGQPPPRPAQGAPDAGGSAPPDPDEGTAPAVPDGGTQRGHGADDDPGAQDRDSTDPGAQIRVPERDSTPPLPVVELGDRRVTGHGAWPEVTLPIDTRYVSARVTGTDRDGGMGRARVSFTATFLCRDPATGRRWSRPYVQHDPPPMIEPIRVAPGTLVATRLVRTSRLDLDPTRCEGGELASVHGEAWADTTNASGLDATSGHLGFHVW